MKFTLIKKYCAILLNLLNSLEIYMKRRKFAHKPNEGNEPCSYLLHITEASLYFLILLLWRYRAVRSKVSRFLDIRNPHHKNLIKLLRMWARPYLGPIHMSTLDNSNTEESLTQNPSHEPNVHTAEDNTRIGPHGHSDRLIIMYIYGYETLVNRDPSVCIMKG
jgi:hypothetical protein